MGLRQKVETRVQDLRSRYEKFFPAAFFIFGIVFDIFTTDRIDQWMTLVQQAVYIVIIGVLLVCEVYEEKAPLNLPNWLAKVWKYREEAVHFLFGSLLSVFVIFFFKSASIVNSFLFLSLIIALLVLNEFSRFKAMGIFIRFALLSLCLCSYFAYLIPILLGFVGLIPFLVALILSTAMFAGLIYYLVGRGVEKELLIHRIARPAYGVVLTFLLLYLLQLIPPVPISLSYIGIYQKAEKQAGKYKLYYDRPWWAIWQNGAQTFLARPGDRIYCFVRIFSPTGFKDQVQVRWLFKGKKGWEPQDAIPMQISGGRDDGFRGVAFKDNYQAGHWRVQLETTDGREIGRIGFEVVIDTTTEERQFETDEQ